jgi:transposase
VRELTADEPVLASLAESLQSVIAVMTKGTERVTKWVVDEVQLEPTCGRLVTAPGFGPLTALAFRATIGQPERFRRSHDIGVHLGLTPRRYQPGKTYVQGGISRCGDELICTALYEAANSQFICRSMVGVARLGHEHRQTPRYGAGARCAARKLAMILHRIWVDGSAFCWGK